MVFFLALLMRAWDVRAMEATAQVLGHVNATIESNQTGFFGYCSICHVQASQDVKVEYPKTENFNQVFF